MQTPATIHARLRRSAAATYCGKPEEVARARALLRRELRGCPAADDIILCASELAANAVLHSDSHRDGGTFTVRAKISPGEYVLIAVQDDGGPWVDDGNSPGWGRGLSVVSTLASDWGVQAHGRTRTVWASFDW